MAQTYIFEGKTTTEAIEKGLKELKMSKDKVEIKVLENEDKRSFFSILSPRIVKVEIKVNEETVNKTEVKESKNLTEENYKKAKENIENFLNKIKETLPTKDINFEIKKDNSYVLIEITGKELNYLIGYRGEVLNSFQKIVSSIGNKGIEDKVKFVVDIEGYRDKRKKVLEELADKIAKSVIQSKKRKTLEPMSAYERKVIHSRLQNYPEITTQSIGEEPNRRVVISLKK